jgi:HK97 family phage major capsid protein
MTPKLDPTTIRPAAKRPDWIKAILDPQFIGAQSYEHTLSEKAAKEAGIVPAGIFLRGNGILGLSDGATTVQTTVQTVAQALQPFSALVAAGATVLDNVPSNLSFPRMDTASAPVIANDGDDVAFNAPTFGSLVLNAQRVASRVGFTRQVLQQATGDIKAAVQMEVLRAIGASVDKLATSAILAMTSQAQGATDYSKVFGVTLSATVTHAKTVDMVTAVRQASVVNDGSFAWVMDAASMG